MKKNLCLLLVCLLSAAAPLQAQDMQQAQKLIDQAQKYLYNNPKQASYYAAQASALFPEDEPSEVRAQAMILYCQAEQLLGNFDLSIKNLYDTQKYIHPTNKKQMAQLCSLMGRVYSKLGDYNKAIELNDKATSIFKSIGDSTSVAGCYNERGVMHHFMSEFTVAERFFQRALAHQPCPTKPERDCNQPEQPLSVPGKYGRETFFHPGSHHHQQESGCPMVSWRKLQQHGETVLL